MKAEKRVGKQTAGGTIKEELREQKITVTDKTLNLRISATPIFGGSLKFLSGTQDTV